MCLIALAHRVRSDWPLAVAANRDELYARPARTAHEWDGAPQVFGGRDLQAGGSWLAVARGGRFAAVTNIRGPGREGGPSRGGLVAEFVTSDDEAMAFAARVKANEYAGFHLIVFDGTNLGHVTNNGEPRLIAPGLFAVSNAPFGIEWPKAAIARDALAHAMENANDPNGLAEELLAFLGTQTGEAIESEIFVAVPERGYGTRSSTAVIIGADNEIFFRERNWPGGETISRIIPAP